MDTTTPRVFRIPFDTITMSERRIMASKFGVNWDAVEVELAAINRPTDPENMTDADKIELARQFTKAVGPNERFALLFLAVKRQEPLVSEAEVERRADAGDWVLSVEASAEEADAGPLPAPTVPTSSESS